MKKIIIVLIISALFLVGCASNSDDVIEIQDRFFIHQVNDIVLNHSQYLGRTIQYEGLFVTAPNEGAEPDIHLVYRYILGCCGPEGITGFIVNIGDFEPLPTYSWVKVVGVLEEFVDDNDITHIRLALSSLTELEERGNEFIPR